MKENRNFTWDGPNEKSSGSDGPDPVHQSRTSGSSGPDIYEVFGKRKEWKCWSRFAERKKFKI